MARWFLVRHGETDWNNEGRAQGQSDTPVNDAGRHQAAQVGLRLKQVHFAAAYASDLSRVVETAEPIMLDRSLKLQTMTELREKHYGVWEGMSYKDVEAQYPELFKRLFEENISFAPPEGESDQDLFDRIKASALKLKDAHSGDDNILVVGHGGSLRAFMVCLLDMPVEYMWRFRLSNGGLSVVSVFDNGGVTLDLLNDISHLGELLGK